MKKSLFIIGLALAALTVSCSKDVELQPAVGGKVTLGVAIESETRTALGALNGGKYDVVWSEGDCLAVNGTKSEAVEAAYVGKTTAQFTVSGVEAPYNVLYPASILGKDGNITVPTVQNYTEGSFAAGSAVAVGYTTGSAVTLKNLYSFVKLTIAKGDDVALKSVALQTVGGEAISGVYSVDYQNAEIRAIAGQSVIRIMDVPYGSDNKAVVYIAVPAGKYEGGFTVTVTGADGKCMTKKASKITDVPAGYIVSMPEFTYTGTARSEVVITNATEFVDFATIYNNGFDGVALLGNDIDMTGAEELPYFSLLEGALFDGQGYAIKNWTSNHGLINVNYGTVKNLTIDQSCNLTFDMSNTDASTPHGLVVNSNVGLVSGCINNADVTVTAGDVIKDRVVGSIVGIMGTTNFNAGEKSSLINARVENCINNGELKIELASYNSGWMFVGGVVGSYYPHAAESTGGVFNCVNNGNITVNIANNKNLLALGGVVGTMGKIYTSHGNNALIYATAQDCVNNGTITYTTDTSNHSLAIGGVAGVSHANLYNAYNNAPIYITTRDVASGKNSYLGGVVGLYSGNINNAHNKGNFVYDSTEGHAGTMYIGGVAGMNVNKNVDTMAIEVTNCSNSGSIEVSYFSTNNYFHYVGGTLGAVHNSGGTVAVSNHINKGEIKIINTSDSTGTRLSAGGLFGGHLKTNSAAATNCANSGNVSLSGILNVDSTVAGVVGSLYVSLENCSSVANVSLNNTIDPTASTDTNGKALKSILGGFVGRVANVPISFNNCLLGGALSYQGNGAVFGLIAGDTWAGVDGTTGEPNICAVGDVTPNKIKATTTVNGVAVTAEDLLNKEFLLGVDQALNNGTVTESSFRIAEGGVVLE